MRHRRARDCCSLRASSCGRGRRKSKNCCATPGCCSIRRVTGAGIYPRPRPSCNRMRSTWQQTCLNDLGVERIALMADTTLPLRFTAKSSRPRIKLYREMRTKLDAMGPVNMMALEEYKETAERHTFLETQRNDLISIRSRTPRRPFARSTWFRDRSLKRRSRRSTRISRRRSKSCSAAATPS